MRIAIKNASVDILITSVCVVIAYLIHINSFLDLDVVWHVEAARRVLSGGHYLINLFDDNDIYVYGFYFPVIWLYHAILLPVRYLIPLYVLIINSLSLAFCYYLLTKAYHNDCKQIRIIYYTLVISLYFLPLISLGQREMVLVTFILPYFLIKVFSVKNPSVFKVKTPIRLLSALLAAFGIMQNIIYVSLFVLIDIYQLFFTLRGTKQIRYERIIFYACVIFFSLMIYFLFPSYVKNIIPLVLCYERGFNFTLEEMTTSVYSFFCLVTILIILVNYKKLKRQHDILLSLICALGAWLIYLFEKKLWYYHIYPAYFFSLLALVFLVSLNKKQLQTGKNFEPNTISVFLAVGILIYTLIFIINGNFTLIKEFYSSKSDLNQWITYTNTHFRRDEKLFYFNNFTTPGYAMPIFTQSEVVSPWFNAWFIPYLLKLKANPSSHFCNLKKDINIFFLIFENSIKKNKPDIIIIQSPNNPNLAKPELRYAAIFTVENLRRYLKDYFLYDCFKENYIF